MGSPKFDISGPEIQKFVRDTLVFAAPLALLYLTFVSTNITDSGVSLAAFVPNNTVIGAITLYILNTATNFLRKFVPETK